MPVDTGGVVLDRNVAIPVQMQERSSGYCNGDVPEYSGSPLAASFGPLALMSETVATLEDSVSELGCKNAADFCTATNKSTQYMNQPSRSNSVSTQTTASGYGQRLTRDSGFPDEASSTISTSPLVTATSACSPIPSSGTTTPVAEPSGPAGSISPEESSKDLPPGLTANQLWKFVIQVSKGKHMEGDAEKTGDAGDQRHETARRALASASVSLNVAATTYGTTGIGNGPTLPGEKQDQANALFDCALLDSSVSRTETIGSRIGMHRRVQARHELSADCYARQYPQRHLPLPESGIQLHPSLSGVRVTRNTAKRAPSVATAPADLPRESTFPLMPAPKRRRGSHDSGKGSVFPCRPRELSDLLQLLAENAKQVAQASDGNMPAALDCSFWKTLQEQMNDVAKQERKLSAVTKRHNFLPQFLSRLPVACSTCRATPQSIQNNKKRKREQHDPTRPGCPLPSPRCVPKYLAIPSAVYRVPTFRQCLCQWIASQRGTPVDALENLEEGVLEDVSPLQLPPRVYFSSRVTDNVYAEEEPRIFLSGYLPFSEEEADYAPADQARCLYMEAGQNAAPPDEVCAEVSTLPSAPEEPFTSTCDQSSYSAFKDGVYFDHQKGCWKATVQRRNQVITKHFTEKRTAHTMRHPHEVLYGVDKRGAAGSYSSSVKHPEETRATLYYDWVSKHFREVCKYLESVPASGKGTRGVVATASAVDRLASWGRCATKRSTCSAMPGASWKSSSPLPTSESSYAPVDASSRKHGKLQDLERGENGNKAKETSNPLIQHQECGKALGTKRNILLAQSPPPIQCNYTDDNVRKDTSVCETSTIARQFVLRQCQRLLEIHRQHLSDQLSQNTTPSQNPQQSAGNVFERCAMLPGETANPKGPSQANDLPALDDVMQRLQRMIRDTLGTVSAPSTEADVSRYQQQVLLLQQMRQHHLDMQRLVINTASSVPVLR
uniref:AP2 domain transcription factor AP2IX-4 n=1 Tax=Toxoplasma gondii COUG TaxID=1074873 RepID=A0A2G8Y382_TOXGO|nr:AP2 domain transcription factor AP2IX-4 [Toxoplasma gondii COUG]